MSVSQSRFPAGMARCRHIKTNGTQCGSPALSEKELCYYHQQNRPQAIELYIDDERYADNEIMLPVFEDAHSLQTALRQVLQLLLQHRINRKDAALALYALQIASGNLKMIKAEKAKPTQVVVEPDKTAETPLGMTPWSASGQGHDPEDEDSADPQNEQISETQESGNEDATAEASEERWAAGSPAHSHSVRTSGTPEQYSRPGRVAHSSPGLP